MRVFCLDDFHHNPHGDTVLHSEYEGRHGAYLITSTWQAGGPITTWDKPWQNKGGDLNVNVADTAWFTDNPVLSWLEYDITEMVKLFVDDPSKNYGVMLDVAMDNPQESHKGVDEGGLGQDTVYQGYTFVSAKPDSADLEPYKPQVIISWGATGIDAVTKNAEVYKRSGVFSAGQRITMNIGGKGKFQYNIYDISGKRMVKEGTGSRGVVNGVALRQTGIYIVQVTYDNTVFNQKVNIVR